MTREGTLRQHLVRRGVRHDIVWYGALKDEVGCGPSAMAADEEKNSNVVGGGGV